MKTALRPNSKKPIVASSYAPAEARCPTCGGVVLLRRRSRMNGEDTYFWRHQDNCNRSCRGRSRRTS